MQYPWAVPGQEVVCIIEGPWDELVTDIRPPEFPKFMQTYKIFDAKVHDCGALFCSGHPVIELEQIRGWFFETRAFQPVQSIPQEEIDEAKSDLDLALELLNT